jgi:farnesyl diphosphate synthase
LFQASYGSKDASDVAKVKAVYDELNIPKMYKTYEENGYNDIVHQISHLSGGVERRALNPEIFQSFLARIYKRDS